VLVSFELNPAVLQICKNKSKAQAQATSSSSRVSTTNKTTLSEVSSWKKTDTQQDQQPNYSIPALC
jgi:hypothetical protein